MSITAWVARSRMQTKANCFSHEVRQLMLVHEVLEPGSPALEIIAQVVVGTLSLAEVGQRWSLLRHG